MKQSPRNNSPHCIEPLYLPQLHALDDEVNRRHELSYIVPSTITDSDLRALSALPDPHHQHRVYFPSNHLSLAIDGRGTCDIDDAISLSPTGNLLVHIADPTRYLLPAASSPVICKKLGCLLELALKSHGSLYLPSHNIAMLPRLLTNHLLSLGAPLSDGSTLTVELCAHDPFSRPDVYLSSIPPPLRLTYDEADRLLNECSDSQSAKNRPVTAMLHRLHDVIGQSAPSGVVRDPWQRWRVSVARRTGPVINTSTSGSVGARAAKRVIVSPCNRNEEGEARRTVAGAMTLACIAAGSFFARLQDEQPEYFGYGHEQRIVFAYRAGGSDADQHGNAQPVEWTTSTGRVHQALKATNYARVTSPMRRPDDLVNHIQFKAWLTAEDQSLGRGEHRRAQGIMSRLFGSRNHGAYNHSYTAGIYASKMRRLGETQNSLDAGMRVAALHLRNYWTVEQLRRDAESKSDKRMAADDNGPASSCSVPALQHSPVSLSGAGYAVSGTVISVSERDAVLRVEKLHAVRSCAGAPNALVQLDGYGAVVALRAPKSGKRVSEGENVTVRLHTFDVERGEVRATVARQTFAAAAIKRRREESKTGEDDGCRGPDARRRRVVTPGRREGRSVVEKVPERVPEHAPERVPKKVSERDAMRFSQRVPDGVPDRECKREQASAGRKSVDRKWMVDRKASQSHLLQQSRIWRASSLVK